MMKTALLVKLRSVILLLLASMALSACQSGMPANASPQLNQLLDLMNQRLAVAPTVATSKWNTHAPIDDPAREQVILEQVARQGEDLNLSPEWVRTFFQAQFDAGKIIQQQLHAQWQAEHHAAFDPAPDLARDVRPVLDQLTPQLLLALRQLLPTLCQPFTQAAVKAVNQPQLNWPPAVREVALKPLVCQF